MRIKIRAAIISGSGNAEANITVGHVYDVISMHGAGDTIYAVVLDDNNHLYVTANPINPPAINWQLVSVIAESSEQLYPLP
jgi:hypothetical protein